MADEGRRPGDWQRRDLRENANDIVGAPDTGDNPKKWHQQTFWIVFFVILVWPLGLVLLWRSDWHLIIKILITLFVAFTLFFAWGAYTAVNQL